VEQSKADFLLLGVLLRETAADVKKLNAALKRLSRDADVWVGLPEDHPARDTVTGVRYFTRFQDLDLALTERITRTSPR